MFLILPEIIWRSVLTTGCRVHMINGEGNEHNLSHDCSRILAVPVRNDVEKT